MASGPRQPDCQGLSIKRNLALLSATGAALTLVGGFALRAAGVAALAVGAMGLVVAPALWILGDGAAWGDAPCNSPTTT